MSHLVESPGLVYPGIPRTLQQYIIIDIQLGEEIGRGSYSTVVEATWQGSVVAVKEFISVLDDLRVSELQSYKQKFFQECEQNFQLSHINIVHFIGIYYPPGALLPRLVMKKLHCSLTRCLEDRRNTLISKNALLAIIHIARGLKYLHSHSPPIVHHDLSSDNILLAADMTPKINCLNAVKFLDANVLSQMARASATSDFIPPEVLSDQPQFGPEVDVFSFGCVMLHTLSRQWPSPSEPVITDPVTQQPKSQSEVDRRQQYFDVIESEKLFQKIQLGVLFSLIKTCLCNLPKDRPSIARVYSFLDHLYVNLWLSLPVTVMNLEGEFQGLYMGHPMLNQHEIDIAFSDFYIIWYTQWELLHIKFGDHVTKYVWRYDHV